MDDFFELSKVANNKRLPGEEVGFFSYITEILHLVENSFESPFKNRILANVTQWPEPFYKLHALLRQ